MTVIYLMRNYSKVKQNDNSASILNGIRLATTIPIILYCHEHAFGIGQRRKQKKLFGQTYYYVWLSNFLSYFTSLYRKYLKFLSTFD